MIYAVDHYMDQIRVKAKREYDGILKKDKYHYFDVERDARDFIRKRAQEAVRHAEAELDRALARSRKCYKKFPPVKIPEPEQFAAEDSQGAKK